MSVDLFLIQIKTKEYTGISLSIFELQQINLFVTSKNETTNSPIDQFTNLKSCIKAREPFYPLFNDVLFITLKKHFKSCFLIF